jgi:hypothetical protein
MTDNLLDDKSDPQPVDPNKNYLEELVGDNKKFKTPEEFARGKYESDTYIRFLEKGRDELRDDYLKLKTEYDSRAKLEEIVTKLTTQQQLASSEHTLNAKEEVKQPQYDPKEIESLVSSKIQEHELTRRQEDNFNVVRNKLQQRYGQNYKDAVKQQIDELGITESDLNEMARKQPKVLIRTLGLDQEAPKEDFQAPPRSQQRSDNFAPSTQKRTWAFYEKLRKEDSNLYYSPKTQVQMHQDHANLGKEFEDGTWRALG